MKNIFFIISIIAFSMVGCNKDASNPIVKNESGLEFLITENDILSQDSNFIIGSLSYDSQTEQYTVEMDSSSVLDYIESIYSDSVVNNYSIRIVDNYIYLYYTFSNSSTLIKYAEDVIIDGTLASSIGGGAGESHSCDGACGGANNIITICTSCDFDRSGGKIIGCKCLHSPGICCHTKTSS
jgi:hypothetical protein